MKFLCPRHRSMFASLLPIEQNNLWMFWMESALTFYESRNSEKAIMMTGNAFDLAHLARTYNPDCMKVELTLSAILLCRSLRGCGEHCVAEDRLLRALESLRAEPCQAGASECDRSAECIEILLDTTRQHKFLVQYLNWPSGVYSFSTLHYR